MRQIHKKSFFTPEQVEELIELACFRRFPQRKGSQGST